MKALTFALILALPSPAWAVNMKFCVTSDTMFQDSGQFASSGLPGEDYWLTPWPTPVARSLRGAKVYVNEAAHPYLERWQGYLGDGLGTGDFGNGCTDWFSVPTANQTYQITVQSRGYVNGWYLRVRNRFTQAYASQVFAYPHTSGAGQHTVQVTGLTNTSEWNDYWDLFNTYQASSWSLYRHGGGMLCTQTLDIMVGNDPAPDEDDCSGGPCLDTSAGYASQLADFVCPQSGDLGKIFIANGFQDRKFQVSHEIGHAVFYRYTGKNASDCGFADTGSGGQGDFDDCLCGTANNLFLTPTPARADGGGKSWHTIEYAGCAQYEGFAQFYSADVWNDHSQEDCYFKSYTSGPDTDGCAPPPAPPTNPQVFQPNVNCELGSPDPDPPPGVLLPRGYMENMCGADASDLPGMGTQLDWVRVYWNVHTEPPGVDFWDMMDWMNDARSWDKFQPYNFLDDAAAARNDQLETNWNAAKNFLWSNEGHGINHPGPEPE